MRRILLSLSIVGALVGMSGCAELTDPYYGGGGGGYDPYGYNRDDYYRDRERERLYDERRDLERERDRLQRERDRLNAQHDHGGWRPPPPPPPPVQVRPQPQGCPPGFSPSERKCSPEERRRGCRDIRTPSGLGCVSR